MIIKQFSFDNLTTKGIIS